MASCGGGQGAASPRYYEARGWQNCPMIHSCALFQLPAQVCRSAGKWCVIEHGGSAWGGSGRLEEVPPCSTAHCLPVRLQTWVDYCEDLKPLPAEHPASKRKGAPRAPGWKGRECPDGWGMTGMPSLLGGLKKLEVPWVPLGLVMPLLHSTRFREFIITILKNIPLE